MRRLVDSLTRLYREGWRLAHRRPIRPFLLLSLAGFSGGIFLFIKLVSEIAEGETHRIDEAILRALRTSADLAQPVGPAWLQVALTDVTSLGGTTVLSIVTLLVVGFLLSEGKRRPALIIAASVAGGALLSSSLKIFIGRPRPDLVAHLVSESSPSFPSGHAMLSAVTYLTLGALLAQQMVQRRTQVFVMAAALSLTVAVGFSRVYLGVHYPTDVLGGWCAGATWAALCLIVAAAIGAYDKRPDHGRRSDAR